MTVTDRRISLGMDAFFGPMRGCTAHTGEDAAHIVDSLMFAQLHGIDSYGLQRIPMYDRLISNPEGGVDVNTRAEVVRQTPVSAVVDGHHGVGHCFAAIDPAIFGDPDAIIARFSDYLDEIRRIPVASGRRVYVHGDQEETAYRERTARGTVTLDPETVASLATVSGSARNRVRRHALAVAW